MQDGFELGHEVTIDDVLSAAENIRGTVKQTPILESSLLNRWLGKRVLFKAECFQTTGAFKLRGATNFLCEWEKRYALPSHIVANSSGNHAQAVAYAASQRNIPVTIFASNTIASVKAAATQAYGAELKLFDNRTLADNAVAQAAEQPDTVWIPPFDHPWIIAGQGTAALEGLEQVGSVDAVFAPCGGGGLLGGTLLATRHAVPDAMVIGAEPLNANDATMSLQSGVIERLPHPPQTLADGAATPAVGLHTFKLLQQLDDFYEVSEEQIAYWTQWLMHLLKIHVEPTSAMTMAAVAAWAAESEEQKTALVILSGGNISAQTLQLVWQKDYLTMPPDITSQR